MKSYFLSSFLVLAAMTVSGCSSDDNALAYPDKLTNPEQTMTFRLLDSNMKDTRVFKENDNIIFDFAIENKTMYDLTLKKNFDGGDIILSDDFFSVYTENGDFVGVPWTGVFCEESMQDTWLYPPHSVWHITCSWYARANGEGFSSHPFCGGSEGRIHRPVLAKGRYYVKFPVEYNASIGQKTASMKEEKFIINFEIE